jgi:5'-3' exonuclease
LGGIIAAMARKKTVSEEYAGKRKTLALLDVHAILHRAYHALPEFESSKGEPTGALYGLCTMLIKLVKDIKPDYIVACYDLPGPTERHEAYADYKAKLTMRLLSNSKDQKIFLEPFEFRCILHPGLKQMIYSGLLLKK